jgi:hypothetical protein
VQRHRPFAGAASHLQPARLPRRDGDHRLNGDDVADASKALDFNGDRSHDARDAAFLLGVDIALDPQREAQACGAGSKREPEYAVAHGYFEPSDVSCDGDKEAVLLVGVGGGVVNLKDREDAAGVRSMIDGIQRTYDGQGAQTIAVLAGPAVAGGANVHTAMEQWLAHAVRVYLERYPCLRVLLLGHSHGAVTADVVAAALEDQYADRIMEVVDVDRVTTLYTGDTQSRPARAHVLNIYEHNGGPLQGAAYDSVNATNWDASDQQAPSNGDKGGALAAVNHTTIDNSAAVKAVIVADAKARLQ